MDAFDLETPFAYVDLDVLERNLRRMQERCDAWGVALRPHVKTHKVPEIARLQLALGAKGITVAKLSEADVMPGDDVLIAYPILPDKVPRLRELAKKRRVLVTVDSIEGAKAVAGIDTLVEVDLGFGRCGVPNAEAYADVAAACDRFQGLFYYPNGLDEPTMQRGAALMRECVQRRAAPIVSGGSTPNAAWTPSIPETTEVRPGTYVFNDASVVALGLATPADCALRMLVSVVSTAVRGQCVIDAGSKTFSLNPAKVIGGYGQFADRPWRVEKLNEEHGYVSIGPGTAKVGEKLWVIPARIGTCVNLHDEIAYGRGGRVEGIWRVAARGCVR